MRYELHARNMNIFKDGRSYSNIRYTEQKKREVEEIITDEISIVPVKDSNDFLTEAIDRLHITTQILQALDNKYFEDHLSIIEENNEFTQKVNKWKVDNVGR